MSAREYDQVFHEAIRAGENRDYKRAAELLTWLVASTDRYPQALIYLGRSYHAMGHFAKAIPVFEFYLKLDPESGPGHFFLGRTHLALGNYGKAAENLLYASEESPEFSQALSLLGLCFLKMRRPDHAIRTFRRALEIDPDDQRVFTGYLNALMVKSIRLIVGGEYEEAERNLRFILQHRSDSILPHIYIARIYREWGDGDRALSHYEQASRLSPRDPVFPLLKAVIFLQKGDGKAAMVELEGAQGLMKDMPLTRDPMLLLRFLAISLFQQKRYRDALRIGRQVLKANYRDADIHGIFAETYLHFEEYEKARNHFRRCLEIDRSRREFHYGLALALWELRDFAGLLSAAERLRRMNPHDRAADYFRSLCRVELEEDPRETIPLVQELIRSLGPDVHLLYALGREYLRSDMASLAEGWLLRTLKLDEDHRGAYLSLRQVYRELGKPGKERDILKRYVARFPEDYGVKRDYVRLLIEQEDYERAAQQIVSLLSRFPKSRALKKNLARCSLKAERYRDAALLYREMLRDEPDSISHLRSLTYCLEKIGNAGEAVRLLELARGYFEDSSEVLLPLGVLYFKTERFEEAAEIFRAVTEKLPEDWRAYQNLAVLYRAQGQGELADRFLERARRCASYSS